MDEEDASSRASSPSKSPLLGAQQGQHSSPFLDQDDQPLARQPQGARAAARLSQQGLGGGGRPAPLQMPFDGGAAAAAAAAVAAGMDPQQTRRRPPSPLGRRPGLPNWQGDEGLPAAPRSGGMGGGGGGLFGGGAAPSDPMTYQMQAQLDKDGVPNLGDVQDGGLRSGPSGSAPRMQPAAAAAAAAQQAAQQQQQQWHIPAVHTTPGTASRSRRMSGLGDMSAGGGGKRGLPDKKPGAAFKLGKRQAYLKYLAYEVRCSGWRAGDRVQVWCAPLCSPPPGLLASCPAGIAPATPTCRCAACLMRYRSLLIAVTASSMLCHAAGLLAAVSGGTAQRH